MVVLRLFVVLAIGYATSFGYASSAIAIFGSNELARLILLLFASLFAGISAFLFGFSLSPHLKRDKPKGWRFPSLVSFVFGYFALVAIATAIQIRPEFSGLQWWGVLIMYSIPFIGVTVEIAQEGDEERQLPHKVPVG